PAGRDPRARQQGGGGGAERQGEPDPSPGGDRGNAFAAEHRQADGGQPAPPAAQGARVARAPGREGRQDRPPRRRQRGSRRAAHPARAPEGAADGVRGAVTRRKAAGRPAAFRVFFPYAPAADAFVGPALTLRSLSSPLRRQASRRARAATNLGFTRDWHY